MPRNRLSLTVRVSCEIYLICLFYFFTKLRQQFSFSTDGNILRLKIIVYINSKLTFRQIPDMSIGRNDFVWTSQKFFNCRRLWWWLNDNKIFGHFLHTILSNCRHRCLQYYCIILVSNLLDDSLHFERKHKLHDPLHRQTRHPDQLRYMNRL